MLTAEQLRRTARLMDQVGELRPGFLRDGDAMLAGPHGCFQSPIDPSHSGAVPAAGAAPVAKISVHFVVDPVTGAHLVELD